MYLPPFFVNTAYLATFKEGKEDYVEITFGCYREPDEAQKKLGAVGHSLPVVTLRMSRVSWKYIQRQFQGFMAKQEEGANLDLPPFPKKEGSDADAL